MRKKNIYRKMFHFILISIPLICHFTKNDFKMSTNKCIFLLLMVKGVGLQKPTVNIVVSCLTNVAL